MIRPPDPGTFDDLQTVEVDVSALYRLSRSSATEPYWGNNAGSRFDDPHPEKTRRFGVLYCGDRLETAFAESILHGNALFKNGAFEVSNEKITARELVTFKRPLRPTLLLADLSGEALKSIGLSNDISACPRCKTMRASTWR